MRKLTEQAEGRLAIRYRAFLLSPEPDNRPARKEAIMGHWAMAKSHPGGEEINPELMARRDFPYPIHPGRAPSGFRRPERARGAYLEGRGANAPGSSAGTSDDARGLVAAARRLGAEPG